LNKLLHLKFAFIWLLFIIFVSLILMGLKTKSTIKSRKLVFWAETESLAEAEFVAEAEFLTKAKFMAELELFGQGCV
jgi:hypothetical protein